MSNVMKRKRAFLVVWLGLAAVLLIASFLTMPSARRRRACRNDAGRGAPRANQISLFGVCTVNPGLVSGFVVTAVLLVAAALIRIFAIPRFKYVPGKLQLLLEQAGIPCVTVSGKLGRKPHVGSGPDRRAVALLRPHQRPGPGRLRLPVLRRGGREPGGTHLDQAWAAALAERLFPTPEQAEPSM